MVEIPSRKTHNRVSEALTGENFDRLNKIIDMPSWVYGKKHRRFLHSKNDALLVALMSDDPVKTYMSYRAHILLDNAFSKYKKNVKNQFLRAYIARMF